MKNTKIDDALAFVNQVLARQDILAHACGVLNYDMETICPENAIEEQGQIIAELSNQAFVLTKDEDFIKNAEFLYSNIEQISDTFDRALIIDLHQNYEKTRNITPEMDKEFSLGFNLAYCKWLQAKKASNFSIFAPHLQTVRDINLKQIELRPNALPNAYDNLLDDYERGIKCADLDLIFNQCKARLIPLLQKIQASGKKIRSDFMFRKVTNQQQQECADFLMDLMGFDKKRGALSLSEHPFTDALGQNDVRITTHFYGDNFASSMYSVIHEAGHALFELYQPAENWQHHLSRKTLGMHESVSRFYENRIARSRAFVELIFPKLSEIFPQVLGDVSAEELYEALNIVQPSLIRTEADEFTYTFHIIIRYELEKAIINGRAKIEDLPGLWNEKYRQYLGIVPPNDREGILQDVHWSGGFGYFCTYALGNFYNAMYYNKMQEDFNIENAVKTGDFAKINEWMKDKVFKKADRLEPKDWLFDICGTGFSPEPFLDYIEQKYSAIYGL